MDSESPWGWGRLSFLPICAPPLPLSGVGERLAGAGRHLCSVLKRAKMCLLDMKPFSTSRSFRLSTDSMYFFSFSWGGRGEGTRERGVCGCLIFPSSYADMPGHPEWKGCGQPPSSHPHTPVPDGSQASPCQRPHVLGRSRPPVWLLGLWIRL